jgi:hypothetical protein
MAVQCRRCGKDRFSNKNAPLSGELEIRAITIIKGDHLLGARSPFSRAGLILFSVLDRTLSIPGSGKNSR